MTITKPLWVGAGLTVLLFLCGAGLLAAQEDMGTGRVVGKVVDEIGAPVVGVEVVAASLQSAAKLTATTDRKGNFAIAGFGTGPWRFVAAKAGYVGVPFDMQVRQLAKNPPVTLTLKKASDIAPPVADESMRKDFDEANRLAVEGRLAEAAALYEKLLEKHGGIYQVHLNLGLCDLKLEKLDEAKIHLQTALDQILKDGGSYDKDPAASGRALVGLGEAEMRSGELSAAKDHFHSALGLSPNDEIVAYNVAEILLASQSAEEAISYYELALRIKKDWPKALYKLGMANLNKGNYVRALECLNRFVEVDPDNPDVPQAKGMIEAIKKIK